LSGVYKVPGFNSGLKACIVYELNRDVSKYLREESG
jgi:hypothetical protein